MLPDMGLSDIPPEQMPESLKQLSQEPPFGGSCFFPFGSFDKSIKNDTIDSVIKAFRRAGTERKRENDVLF